MRRRIVEQIFKTAFNNNSLKQQTYTGIKEGSRQAAQTLNSIFQNKLGGTMKAFVPTMVAIGLINDEAEARSKESTLRSASRGDLFRAEVQNYFRTLGKSNEQGAKARQDAIMDLIAIMIPSGKAASSTKAISNKAVKLFDSQGAKAAIDYVVNATTRVRNELVKLSPKAKKQVDDGVMTIEEFFEKHAKDYSMATIDDLEDGFTKLVKANSKALGDLAKEVGVKSKAEIPNVLKFAKELGSIIKNSPNNIKATAKGALKDKVLLGLGGLSLYDLYQEFKEQGDSLIPKGVGGATMLTAAAFAGSPISKILFGALGYTAGSKLTEAALRKLGVKQDIDADVQKEIEAGIRHPGLSEQLPEYIQGQSGRKYHVKGDKIYAFDTGRPVTISQALEDANAYVNFQTQQAEDQLNIVNQQIAEVEQARAQGYAIPEDTVNQLYNQRESLASNIRTLQNTNLQVETDYDDAGDLVEQYRQRVVVPSEQQAQAQQVDRMQNYQNVYNEVFNKIAQDTFDDLDNYYTPENQAVDYFKYMNQYAQGLAPYMSPEEFSRYTKMQTMQQLTPQIRQQAQNQMSSMFEQQGKLYERDLALRKQIEAERAARAGERIKAFEAESGRMSAGASVQNALTNRMELGPKQTQAEAAMINAQVNQQLQPYKQAAYAGEAISLAGQQLPLDQFLQSNQSVMRQVYPETFKSNNPQQEQVQNITNYYNRNQQ